MLCIIYLNVNQNIEQRGATDYKASVFLHFSLSLVICPILLF